jgi:predicted dinucleotide-binding enzyme
MWGGYEMKIGLIGAGYIGRALAELALKNDHEVMISNSRTPDTLSSAIGIIGLQGGKITAGTAREAAEFGDVVVVTIPLKNYRSVAVAPLEGKIVIDTNNYYPKRDGQIAELDDGSATTGALLAAHLPKSKVVKAFNAIAAFDLLKGQMAATAGRRALPIAGDDADAKKIVAGLINQFGFDVVDTGPMTESRRFERGTPAYCVPFNTDGLRDALAKAMPPGGR